MPPTPSLFRLLMIAAMLGPTTAVRADDAVESFSGSAFASDSDVLLYRETHFLRGREHIVLYRCPDGRPFARKLSHDDGDAQAPDFDLTDARLGYREGVRRVDGGREVYVQRSAAQPQQSDLLSVPPDGVIDMGFEVFARHHWDELQRGDTLRFNFPVPSRRKFFAFKVNRIVPSAPTPPGTATFRLGPGTWFSFLLPHIDVTYDVATRRLVHYEGLSNVRDLNGKNYRVRYEAPKIASGHAVSAAEVDAMLVAPLAATCTAADRPASASGQSSVPEVTTSRPPRNPNP